MIIKKNFIIALIALTLSWVNVAHSTETFIVKEIVVEQHGENATLARKMAMQEGERIALERLLRRVLYEYRDGMVEELEPETISSLVIGVDVHNERETATYYKGTFDITFNMQVLRHFLQENILPYVRKKSKATLVLPVVREAGSVKLWGGDTEWFDFWRNQSNASPLISVMVPNNTAENRQLIAIEDIVAKDYTLGWDGVLRQLAEHFNADPVVVVEKYQEPGGEFAFKWQEVRQSGNSIQHFRWAEDTQEKIAGELIARIESRWRKTQSFSSQTQQTLKVDVPIQNITHWRSVVNALQTRDEFSFAVKELAIDRAEIELYFQTSYEELLRALAQIGLYLRESEVGWVLVE